MMNQALRFTLANQPGRIKIAKKIEKRGKLSCPITMHTMFCLFSVHAQVGFATQKGTFPEK